MGNLIIEIPPIGARDCYYIQERYKPCFNYPLHKHNVIELNFVEHCKGARRIVGDNVELLSDMIGMTPNALSRFFKQRTNRSGHQAPACLHQGIPRASPDPDGGTVL